ncbi:MAG: hypothetical protein LBC13_02325 [Clostridiales bacterium]|nr:hypothetical protein [Clostridiales bacterium]
MAYIKKFIILNELEPGWGGVLKLESNAEAAGSVKLKRADEVTVIISADGKVTVAKPVNGVFKLPSSSFAETHCLILAGNKAVAYGSTKSDKKSCLSLQNYNINRENEINAREYRGDKEAKTPRYGRAPSERNVTEIRGENAGAAKDVRNIPAYGEGRFESGFEENGVPDSNIRGAFADHAAKFEDDAKDNYGRFESGFEENDVPDSGIRGAFADRAAKLEDDAKDNYGRFESGFEENDVPDSNIRGAVVDRAAKLEDDAKDNYGRFESGFEENDVPDLEICGTADDRAAKFEDGRKDNRGGFEENDVLKKTYNGCRDGVSAEFENAENDGFLSAASDSGTETRGENDSKQVGGDGIVNCDKESFVSQNGDNQSKYVNKRRFIEKSRIKPNVCATVSDRTDIDRAERAAEKTTVSDGVCAQSSASENPIQRIDGTASDGVHARSNAENSRRNPSLVMDDGISYEGDNFYLAVKPQLDEMFVCYPSEDVLNNLVPYSRWIKVAVEDDYYVVGIISDPQGTPEFICYGIHGNFLLKPPEEIRGLSEWLPLDLTKKDGEGYWIIYQSAITGKCVRE